VTATHCSTASPSRSPGVESPAEPSRAPVVALVGRPNVGKSTFLAHASGRFVESVNAPGTTLIGERHRVRQALAGGAAAGPAWLVDLPGTVSLVDRPAGDSPFWRVLFAERPDAILVVLDATDLARHLPMALACRDLGLPLVVALNLADEARSRGIEIDAGRLSQLLVAPVHVTVGRTGAGVDRAVEDAVRLARRRRRVAETGASPSATQAASPYPFPIEAQLTTVAAGFLEAHSLGAAAFDPDGLLGLIADRALTRRGAATLRLADVLESPRWAVAGHWAGQVERRPNGTIPRRADRLARLATAPWPGLPLFILVTIAIFVTMMAIGGWMATVLASLWAATASPALGAVVPAVLPGPIAASVLWGLDGALLGLISIGIPYVLTFYILLAVLEDSGYLTSAAVLTDRLFNALGLPGRAAIPLLAAAGCNVPAIYGTRVLATRRERLIASFLVTMTPCSARSAVVIAAIAPFAGPVAALAAFGLIAALTIASGVAANRMLPGRQPALILELAPLRRPMARQVAAKAWARFRAFVRSAAPVMIAGSIALGVLYETGLIWPIKTAIAPVVEGWLGLPAVAGLALGFAFLRKELALQLLVALAVVEFGAAAANLDAFMNPAQLFVYAIVASVSVPCVATLATLAGEFGWRAALAMSGATLAVAIGAGGILARLLGIA
jgi:ferrous iron transport protein B